MKSILLLLLITASQALMAQEIRPELKNLLFEQVVMDIYFEDDGFVRMPKIEDLKFEVVESNQIRIYGESYSDWDMKVIGYDCLAIIDSRSSIPTEEEVSVNCILEGEEWPYAN